MNTASTEHEIVDDATKPLEKKGQRASWAVFQGIVGRGIIILLNASTGILTARALLPEGRGELAAMTLWPLFLAYITSLGMPSALIYFLRNRKEESVQLISTGILASMLLGCLATLGGAFLLPMWLHQYPPQVVRAAQLFLLTTPLCAMIQAGRGVLEASGSFLASNIIQVSQPAATLVMLVVLLLTHRLNPLSAGFVYTIAALPTLIIVLSQVRYLVPGSWRVNLASLKLLLSYGIRSYGVDILGALALQVDQVLVIRLLTPSAMGSYGVALSLSRMFNLFQGSVVTVLFPRASGRTADEIVHMTEFSTRVSTLVTGSCALLAAAVGPFLLKTLYGREYSGATLTLEILLVEVTLSGAVYILAQAYMALGRPGMVTIIQAVGLSLSIPMMLILIPRWGINGAAVALLISTMARFLFVYLGYGLILKIRRPYLIPQLSDARAILHRLKKPSVKGTAA